MIVNVDLGRVRARPGACDTTTVCLGLFTAHDLHAVREDLGFSRYGAELLVEAQIRGMGLGHLVCEIIEDGVSRLLNGEPSAVA